MRVVILPSGVRLVDTASGDDEAGDGLSVAARGRITRAFGRGPGYGVLQLGAASWTPRFPLRSRSCATSAARS